MGFEHHNTAVLGLCLGIGKELHWGCGSRGGVWRVPGGLGWNEAAQEAEPGGCLECRGSFVTVRLHSHQLC